MLIAELLNLFPQKPRQKTGSGWNVLCPAHPDRKPSLSVTQTNNRLLLKCQAGCQTEAIVERLGLTMSDLFSENKRDDNPRKTIIAEYSYKDENGNELFQVVRYQPKSFTQRHRNSNNEWAWNTEGVRKVLYHLPELLITGSERAIYFVEGEKDTDTLWQYGQVATTSPGGSNAWQPEYAEPLTGKRVVIIPDNDPPGLAYARAVTKSIQGKAQSVTCIILKDADDISDWLEKGNDIVKLPSLEQDISALFTKEKAQYQRDGNSIFWHKGEYTYQAESIRQERTGIHAKITVLQEDQAPVWTSCNIEKSDERIRLANQVKKGNDSVRQSLDLFCVGLWDYWIGSEAPELMRGEDTVPPSFCLYPYILDGGGTILFAPPGRGKSVSALLWAQSINAGVSSFWQVKKQPVLYINLERSSSSLKRRLAAVNRILGLDVTHPLLTLNRRGQSLSALAPSIAKAIEAYGVKVIVLDSISRAGYGDLTENRPVNLIIDTLSNLCPTWLALGHTPRADESHVFGGVLFDAGADILVQLTSEVEATKLGIKYEIVKSNDLPSMPAQTWSLEFEEWGLKSIQRASAFEFAELEMKKKPKMIQVVMDFILNQDTADATATEIADKLSYNRQNVSELLSRSGKFVKTRTEKRAQYYGVKEKGDTI